MPEMKYPILDIFENEVPEPARCPNMLKNTRSMPEKLMPDHSLLENSVTEKSETKNGFMIFCLSSDDKYNCEICHHLNRHTLLEIAQFSLISISLE